MSDLKQLIIQLSTKEMSRKQFLTLAAGSFLGVIGFFHIRQSLSTPDMTQGEAGAFGDKDYGHTGSDVLGAAAEARKKSFSMDSFG